MLDYIIGNCIFAYDELCKVNSELIQGMNLNSKADVNHLGSMNRMIQDYLIIRVGGLFDRTKGVVSLVKIFAGKAEFEEIQNDEIIQYIIKQRHSFVAHNNRSHFKNDFPITDKICNSNLRQSLLKLTALLKK